MTRCCGVTTGLDAILRDYTLYRMKTGRNEGYEPGSPITRRECVTWPRDGVSQAEKKMEMWRRDLDYF